jgi:simple sugar transport system substrate-binding protein
VKTSTWIAIVLVVAIIAGIAGYFAGQSAAPTPPTGPTTPTPPTGPAAPTYKPPEKIKALFIYVGPIGDAGWTYMHDIGRKFVQSLFSDWLETTYVENVKADEVVKYADLYVPQGYNVIFTTSFDFMDDTIKAAEKYPNIMFFHCSGYRRRSNVGTYFADLYQIYYLNGLMAGALTKTGQIGYVAAYLIPEVVRHINAFAIGAREVGEALGKNITVHVIEIGAWYDPTKAKQAADTLVKQYNVDVLAFTEDSTAIPEYAEENKIYVFSHYGPMLKYAPTMTVSGQLVRWEMIYADILVKIKTGVLRPDNLENVDYWYLLSSGAVELGADIDEKGKPVMINPIYEQTLKNIMVTDKLTGEKLSVYDLVMKRYWQMKMGVTVLPLQFSALTHKYENLESISMAWGGKIGARPYPIAPEFDPFIGPLKGWCLVGGDKAYSTYCKAKSAGETVTIPAGVRLGHDDLWNMDYLLDIVVKH